MTHFIQLTLRTTDVDAARAFYTELLGDTSPQIVQLHEQAIARGARPHWLGLLGVADVDAAMASFAQRGATALGPKWVNPAGLEAAVMRDPGGAIVGLARWTGRAADDASRAPVQIVPEVVWYTLNTADVERARANYSELFGWNFEPPTELGSLGLWHPFSWAGAERPVGSMSDIAERPLVHPHWLFHFAVASVERAVETVQRAGGQVFGPFTLPDGQQLAVCDDPQGAAFALSQPG